ncbi:trichohyalin-like isoform X2 [Acipenser ruthenus]|uniref:trichohyalin-like isoform X2 n=1 Tax=Acipenser ruthenus TaxID=7906 RepID=UPI002741F85C|nr:trichohyalin-like isoform X2 [Acipenser ruthenus]
MNGKFVLAGLPSKPQLARSCSRAGRWRLQPELHTEAKSGLEIGAGSAITQLREINTGSRILKAWEKQKKRKQREVCQGFAVLEDGALAHNLQEQEIEQYYASNVQKNQLVQRDVRIAKRLQDEEDQRRRLTDCRRQIEEQDSEYAQTIQEDIRRRAEEARRREEQDEEIAKKLQEEEELEIRRRRLDSGCQGNQTGLLSNRECGRLQTHQRHQPYPVDWRHSEGGSASRGRLLPPSATANRQRTAQLEPADNSGVPGDCPVRQGSSALQYVKNNLDAAPRGPAVVLPEEDCSRSPRAGRVHRGGDFREDEGWVRSGRRGDFQEVDFRDERGYRERVGWVSRELREGEGGATGYHRDFREREGGTTSSSSHRDFREREGGASSSNHRDFREREGGASSSNHRDFREREGGASSSNHRDFREREGGASSSSSNHRDFREREGGASSSNHRDFREREGGASSSNHRDFREREGGASSSSSNHADHRRREGGVMENGGGACTSHRGDVRVGGANVSSCSRHDDRRERRRQSEHRRSEKFSPSSSEEEEEGGNERRRRRTREHRPHRQHSLPATPLSPAARDWRKTAEGGSCAGAAPPAGLHVEVAQMGLQDREQVLRDAELARRLQEEEEEEERLLRKGQRPENDISPPSPASTGRLWDQAAEEDFRAAQVAQDEEIARFMQRQEMKASRDLEGQGSRMEHSDLTDSSEKRRSQNRKVLPRSWYQNLERAEASPGQHERLDSEGLPSPREEGSPDRRASPAHRQQQQQHLLPRNIAEELDPTFRVKRQEDAAEEPALPTPAAARSPPGPPCRFHDYTDERAEPTFIPPTKRQSDKISRPKTKDRKEGCKQQ